MLWFDFLLGFNMKESHHIQNAPARSISAARMRNGTSRAQSLCRDKAPGSGSRNPVSLSRYCQKSPRHMRELHVYIYIYTDIYIYTCICICMNISPWGGGAAGGGSFTW